MCYLISLSLTRTYLHGTENVAADFFSRWRLDFLEKEKVAHLERLQQEAGGGPSSAVAGSQS